MTNVILEGFHIWCAVENLRVLRSLLTSGCIDLSESACGLTALVLDFCCRLAFTNEKWELRCVSWELRWAKLYDKLCSKIYNFIHGAEREVQSSVRCTRAWNEGPSEVPWSRRRPLLARRIIIIIIIFYLPTRAFSWFKAPTSTFMITNMPVPYDLCVGVSISCLLTC